MHGIEIAEKYYREFGEAAIHENFPELEDMIAVGLAGSGSECYGFDDEISRDHDFEPGFCIWIPEEEVIDERTAFRLERMYAKLPKEYMGLKKEICHPAGGNRHGVIRFSEFLERHIGRTDTELTLNDWFTIPECAFSEIVNGRVWRDDSGNFTAIRDRIRNMPEEVRLKKLAGSLYIMGQSGNYNYSRCIAHGERGAAQLSVAEYVRNTMHAVFLINREYMPYYKWSFRALKTLPVLSELGDKLEYLINTGNEPENIDRKLATMNYCNREVIDAVKCCILTPSDDGIESEADDVRDLGDYAFLVNDLIEDAFIRNADIMAGVTTV